ncbi:MAG: FluC/FEX family fluoride channel [Synechococcus sp.]
MSSTAGEAWLVAAGAVPGAWLRFRLVNGLAPRLPRRHWGTVAVNLTACLALGLLLASEPAASGQGRPLLLLLATGFLGSYSTLSTFCAEVWSELVEGRQRGAAWLALASVAGGLLALSLGLWLGNGLGTRR